MDGFIISPAPRTSSHPKDNQPVIERKYQEMTVSMPMSPGSSLAIGWHCCLCQGLNASPGVACPKCQHLKCFDCY
ncbi:hypothetical protein V2G26_014995 [Clonostachys chloroleuca]